MASFLVDIVPGSAMTAGFWLGEVLAEESAEQPDMLSGGVGGAPVIASLIEERDIGPPRGAKTGVSYGTGDDRIGMVVHAALESPLTPLMQVSGEDGAVRASGMRAALRLVPC